MKAVEIANLSYTYPDGTRALNNLNLQISQHRRVVVLGQNGSGKTTLLYHLNGLLLPQEGQVKIMGHIVDKRALKTIRRKAGLLFDKPDNQLFSTTVFNDIAFGPRNLNLDDELVKARTQEAMHLVGVADLGDKPPYNLSLGQKKKVAIAGVLAMKPELLVFDEPFSGLDPRAKQQMINILENLYTEGCTLIISTHDVDTAYAWADEVIILCQGQILAEGEASLLREKKIMQEAFLDRPILAHVFQGTGSCPRTAVEANKLLTGIKLR